MANNQYLLFLDNDAYPSNEPIKLKTDKPKIKYYRNNDKDTRFTNMICWESRNVFNLEANKKLLEDAGYHGHLYVKHPIS